MFPNATVWRRWPADLAVMPQVFTEGFPVSARKYSREVSDALCGPLVNSDLLCHITPSHDIMHLSQTDVVGGEALRR